MAAQSTTPLLKVEGLKQYFRVNKNFTVKAVDDVSFEIYPGETYGLVGESGQGKTVLALAIQQLLRCPPGKIVETGTIDEIFYDPKHPYTWGLLSAMPDLDTADDRLYIIPGSPPNLLHEKPGDAFAPRNRFALNIDDEIDPPMFKISDTHYAATWLLDPRAPKVEMPPELKERIARMKAEAKKIEEAE